MLAWHEHLRLDPPLSGKRAYKRLVHSLSRFQGVPRRIFFPIYVGAVKHLLTNKLTAHPACRGVRGGCAICTCHLHARRNCLAGATSTVTCSRCADAAGLQVCDLWERFDEQAGYQRFKGGAAVNVKIRKNNQFRKGHQPRLGVPRNPTSSDSCSRSSATPVLRFTLTAPSGNIPSSAARSAHRCFHGRYAMDGSSSQTAPRLPATCPT
jgi:hypothetical protein